MLFPSVQPGPGSTLGIFGRNGCCRMYDILLPYEQGVGLLCVGPHKWRLQEQMSLRRSYDFDTLRTESLCIFVMFRLGLSAASAE